MDNLYANVPRDLTRVKNKLFLNLTKRQILCFSAAIAAGLPLYFLLRKTGSTTLAAMVMILVMLPFFFFALYERNGQPLEVILKHYISARFKRSKIRTYRTRNSYHRKAGNRKDRKAADNTVKKKEAKTGKPENKKPEDKGGPEGRKEESHVHKV